MLLRFRWVTCQIDYLCALPTDSERRKALESLPPDLKSTYKRILRRLQSQPVCTQRLVRRTLKWLLFSATAPTEGYILPLTSSGLCEAISIEFGKDDMETESIPSEEEVLRCCSSFVRSSFAPGPPELRHLRGHYIVEVIELAHFSVKEFFTELSPTDDPEFSEFCMDKDQSTVELVQACLTYLNFRRFGNPGLDHLETFETLVETSPFLPHAVDCWSLYFQNRWSDGSSRSLLQQLFEPATLSRNLIFYLQARYWRLILRNHLRPEISLTEIAAFHQGLRSMTPLHVAALSLQPDLCQWLLDSGCGVNEPSYFGFPLHVTIAGEVLEDVHRSGGVEQIDFEFTFRSHPRYPEQYAQVVDVLVSAGAKLEIGAGLLSQSALQLAVTVAPWKAVALLKSGASPDDGVLQTLLNICADKLLLPSSWGRDIIDIMPYIRKDALTGTVKARFLELSFLVDYQNSPETLQELQATLANQREHQWDSLLHAVKSGKRELVAGLLTSGRFSLHQIIVGEDEKYYGHIEGETLLHYAARWKYLDLIKLLLAIDPTLKNVRDVDMNTPLHSIADPAGIEQIRETAGALLQCGMRSYAINERGWTVWHSACAYGNLELIEALCEYDTDMNVSLRIRDNEGRSPLDVFGCQRFYSAYGNPRVHQALHRLLVLCPNETLGHTDGSTPLHHWVENKFNEPVCIKMLVDSGINPAAARPSDGKTAAHLFYPRQKLPPEPLIDLEELVDYLRPLYSEEIGATAAHDGRLPIHELCASVAKMDPEVFDAFVTLGTAPTVKDRSGRSCLELIVEYLRSEGVDFDSPETQAKAASFIQRVIYHIKEEEDLRCVFESSDVIYALACSAGNDTLIESLLEKRFPVDVGKTMATGFQSACKFSSPEIIRKMLHQTSHQSPYNGLGLAGLACGNNAKFGALSLLISQGCDPNEEYGANRMTPLMIAAQNGREHELGILLESGASISSRDCSGMNALHMAVAHGHDNMTRMLLDEGHDVNSRDGAGMTALHVAVSKGFPLMTLVLLSRGAKIEIKNYEGHTPYQMALDGEKYDIAERLLNWTVCTSKLFDPPII